MIEEDELLLGPNADSQKARADLSAYEENVATVRRNLGRFRALRVALYELNRMPKRTGAENVARLAKAQLIYNYIQAVSHRSRSAKYQSIMINIIFKILAIFSKVWPFCSKFWQFFP